jgi:hypothetical protein
MWGLRLFEFFVMGLVLGVVICFCIQLSLIQEQSVGEVFRGYLPSSAIVQSTGSAPPSLSLDYLQYMSRITNRSYLASTKAAASSAQP